MFTNKISKGTWLNFFFFLDIYEERLEELCTESIKNLIFLQKKLKEEQELVLSLSKLRGAFEIILSASEIKVPCVKNFCTLTPSIIAQKDLILNIWFS